MPRKIYVVGHRNPDTDSVVSAIAYAEILRRQGLDDVVAARQGDLWPETKYILERFGIPVPSLVEDVRPTACDLMASRPIVGKPDESVHAVGQRLREHGIRAMPLVGEDGRLAGVVSVEDFANILLLGLDPDLIDQIHLEVDNVVETLNGRLLIEAQGRKLRDKVLVAAMASETVRGRLEADIMVVLGDREDVQRIAIEQQVGALVVTGDTPVSDEILALAREKNVTLISSPHHTFTTVRLLNLSIPIWHIMRRDVEVASLDEPLDDVREKLSRQRTVPVLAEGGQVMGVVSRSDVINPVRHGVYLVDHNERSQTVDGLDEAELLGIVDHHRIADIQTGAPIFFRNEIVGSTSTLIAGLFEEAGIPIPPAVAGILLGGVITDTVLLRSPTSTLRDRRVAEQLAATAGVDMTEFGREIFARVSDLTGRTPLQILTTDFKEYRIEEQSFAIGYMETVHKRQVDQIRDDLLTEMQALRGRKGYASLLLIVVDIVHNQTEVFIDGMESEVAEALGEPLLSPHSIIMSGIVSRKKQIVPVLPRVVQQRRKNSR
jgi:manganese-dependent inorganic pyrophosphatase